MSALKAIKLGGILWQGGIYGNQCFSQKGILWTATFGENTFKIHLIF